VYAYEVDGLGNSLVDFDDPNIPSLLAIPELGYDGYDKEVRAASTQVCCCSSGLLGSNSAR
jgi:meiotically up-regulated gene 157 (Mug157) protein